MQLGKYQLVRKLATGGMAEVYLAKAAGPMGFEKTLVLKRILPHLAEDPAFVEMFLGEAKLAAQLEHPNIVQIFDFGEAEGSFFLAMELIDGPNLRKLVKRAQETPLPPAICAKLVASAAEGLAYAHEFRDPATGEPLGLIHRDVSPDNVLVSRQGAVKVVDFGIAKVAGQGHRTQTGVVKGKVAYMPPEQLQTKPLDRRVDVYALGVVLYELLTGKRPFDATTDVSMMQAILFEQFIPAAQRRPDLPAALQQVLDKALTKDRDKRYPDCRALQGDLERFVMSTGESVGAYQVAQFVSQWMAEGGGGPVGVTPQAAAAPRVQTGGPKPATAKSMVAPVEPAVESTSPTTPMPMPMPSVVREAAHRSAAARPTIEERVVSGPSARPTIQERAMPAPGQERAPSRSRSDRYAVPALAAVEGRSTDDARKAQEAAVMATQPLPALQPAPAPVGSAAKVDAEDFVHTRSAELSAPRPVRKGSRSTVIAVAVGGALLALGGAIVVLGSGSGGAVPVAVKPLPEPAAPVEKVAAPVVATPPPAVVVSPAPVAPSSGNSVAESAVAQAGTSAAHEGSKPVTAPVPVPPTGKAATPAAPAPAPVVMSVEEKKPSTPARPRPTARPAASTAKGTLEFRIRPYAVVSLNGKVLGQTPFDDPHEVPVGKHTLRLVNKELQKDVTRTIEVKANQPTVFKLNLEAE
ncbi:serine/threonine-protein kinase [Pyxidicoccus trucidator]|uniref:serine/threonine-protein kinase n=1 Tax=Pyxidicoccus trucidator TaxID=2709662 RepID=UPI0013D930A5|nr:serine/threonine-protein kinase [Pyxidicoccus trucidator]